MIRRESASEVCEEEEEEGVIPTRRGGCGSLAGKSTAGPGQSLRLREVKRSLFIGRRHGWWQSSGRRQR